MAGWASALSPPTVAAAARIISDFARCRSLTRAARSTAACAWRRLPATSPWAREISAPTQCARNAVLCPAATAVSKISDQRCSARPILPSASASAAQPSPASALSTLPRAWVKASASHSCAAPAAPICRRWLPRNVSAQASRGSDSSAQDDR